MPRFWLPTYTHPDGPSETPHYREDAGRVWPADGRDSTAPWFSIAEGRVYPAAGHPVGSSDSAWFEVIGSFVYPTPTNPSAFRASAPVYRVADAAP